MEHITLPTDIDFNDMTPCECLTTTVDIFFDALAKVNETNTVKAVNYMAQKISHHVIHHHLNKNYPTNNTQSSPQLKQNPPRIHWMSLLRGFTSSLHPSDLSAHTLNLLTLVDILENVQKCLLGKHDVKTFRILVQLFISVSGFPELQDDEEQRTIFELQQEANTQELIYQYVNKGRRGSKIDKLRDAHPISEFCERVNSFVTSLITEKCKELVAKIPDERHLDFPESQEQETGNVLQLDAPEGKVNSSMEQTPGSLNTNGHGQLLVMPFVLPQAPEQDTPESSMSPESEQVTSRKTRQTSSDRQKSSRTLRRWSSNEESNLMKGIEQYGAGNWKQILNTYKFDNRSSRDLVRKWCYLERKRKACSRTSPYVTKRMIGAISERKFGGGQPSQTATEGVKTT